MALSVSQQDFYKDNGYLVLEGVISNAKLDSIQDKVNQLIDLSRKVEKSDPVFDLDEAHTPENPCVRRIKDPHLHDPLFHEVLCCDEIIDPVAELLGGTVRFDHSKLNFKPPHGDAAIQWHQDWAFSPRTNDDLLTVGVMIEDCTRENGPMMVIPGSHRGPIYDHHHNGEFLGGIHPDFLASLIDDAVECVAPAGSISVHHARTLHASRNNVSNSTRPLLLFSYMAVDTFPIMEDHEIEEFDSRIIRGAPTLTGRMEALPIRIAQPRRKGADSIYDDQATLTKKLFANT